MCGLAGILGPPGAAGDDTLRATALRMADTLRHRGPDDGGAWSDAAAGVALGFRRLAIVDLSPEGRQPMASASGRYVLAFNGEIYNHRELRRELEAAGSGPFRGHSDTEVMLSAFGHWGLAGAVGRFVGMFAFALWDRDERALHLGRDRMGEKPLFYGRAGSAFLFGSELKALRAHPDFRAGVDRDALALYLRLGYVPAPYSIYQGIRKLPPGTTLTIAAGAGDEPGPVPYWSARRAAEAGAARPFEGTEADAADELERLLRDAVGRQMVADVPLGAFLSGGIDSSTVVALMQSQSPRPVRTFTIGFHEAGYDEAGHARAMARHLGTDHTELYVAPAEARAVIPDLPTLFDEPLADSSAIPTSLVSRLARRDVTVSLSGDGGDELFAGYDWYPRVARLWGRVGAVPRPIRRAAAGALGCLSARAWDRPLGLLRPILPGDLARRATGDRVHALAELIGRPRGPEDVHALARSLWPGTRIVPGAVEPTTALTDRSAWADLGGDAASRASYLDQVTYLPDDILAKVDRASMGASLESRAPFLDHRIVEFAWRVPMAWKVREGRGKWLLRQVLTRHVPPALVERPKMGFSVPIGAWLRGPLRDWAEGLLAEDRLRADGLLDPVPIRRRWREHLDGRRDWQDHLWAILMYRSWAESR